MPGVKLVKYDRKMDSGIATAVAHVLDVRVKKAIKMSHGEVNHVYKIVTGKGTFLARIFKHKSWQENGKLQWIEKQLTEHNIDHAKILYYSKSGKFFPHGFMITEFLEGNNGNEAVKKRQISLSKAFFKTGWALKKVHRIKIKKFGKINNGKGQNVNFIENKLLAVKARIRRLETGNSIKPRLYPLIEKFVIDNLGQFSRSFVPVLNHGDANRENAIYTPKGEWVFIDWDNAYAGAWIEDYTELTYWVDWDRKPAHAKRIHELIRKNFFKGYGSHDFSDEQIQKIEKALHIIKVTNMMQYYHFAKKSPAEFKKTREKLYKMLGVL